MLVLCGTQTARQLLGLRKDCTIKDAKAAYRQKIKQYHPDLRGDENSAAAVAINLAYEELCEELLQKGQTDCDMELDVFDRCDGEPDCLFVNPLVCGGVDVPFWYELQLVVHDLVSTDGDISMVSQFFQDNNISVPESAFVYLTGDQYDFLMGELAQVRDGGYDQTAVQFLCCIVSDALVRAGISNSRWF